MAPVLFTMSDILTFSEDELTEEVIAEFRRGFALEAVNAKLRMQRAATFRRENNERFKSSGELTVAAQIDPFFYHYWGQREGYEIWQDEKEIERFTRDTPEMQLEYGGTKVFNGWDGGTNEIVLTDRWGTVTGGVPCAV
jgi:hypothetical protein